MSPTHASGAARGLREAHAHLPALGASMTRPDLSGVTRRRDAIDLIARAASDPHEPTGAAWLIVSGLRPSAWDDPRWPTRAELDAACPHRPCLAMGFDHHSGAVNSRAMTASGFSRSSPDPRGGVIERDGAGEPTGVLLESAYHAARDAAPAPSPAARREHVRRAIAHLRGLGFDEVHDLLSPTWLAGVVAGVLADLARAGEGLRAVRLYPALAELPGAIEQAASAGVRATDRLDADEAVTIAGGKVFVDGTLSSRTAWMLEPYADGMPAHPRGTALMDALRIEGALRRCVASGVGLAAHAIGDGAVRACLDAVQGVGVRGALRIEHAELIDERDVPRFAELGVACSVQPCHLLYDVEVLGRHLPDRLSRVLPLRDLVRAGLEPGRTLLFGSDVPIVRADPKDSILAATERGLGRGPAGGAGRAIAREQALGEGEAWACFGATPG